MYDQWAGAHDSPSARDLKAWRTRENPGAAVATSSSSSHSRLSSALRARSMNTALSYGGSRNHQPCRSHMTSTGAPSTNTVWFPLKFSRGRRACTARFPSTLTHRLRVRDPALDPLLDTLGRQGAHSQHDGGAGDGDEVVAGVRLRGGVVARGGEVPERDELWLCGVVNGDGLRAPAPAEDHGGVGGGGGEGERGAERGAGPGEPQVRGRALPGQERGGALEDGDGERGGRGAAGEGGGGGEKWRVKNHSFFHHREKVLNFFETLRKRHSFENNEREL